MKLAGAYEKLANSRLDFLHITSRSLVRKYSVISLENLNIKGMVQERFGKSINDAGWGFSVVDAGLLCRKRWRIECIIVRVAAWFLTAT